MSEKQTDKHVGFEPEDERGRKTGAPEPPKSYRADSSPETRENDNHADVMPNRESEFESARKLANASKIMAFVSLFIGGVALSSAALITSVIALRKTKTMPSDHATAQALKRSVWASVVISGLALAFNVIEFVYVYPIIMEAAKTGDYAALFGNSSSSAPSGSSFWG